MFKVILKLNNKVLKELKIDQNEIIIGRDTTCDIQIDNIAVSREHATIMKGPNYYFIEDMHSKNGTFVNGQKVSKKLLNTGDEITIGKYFLTVHFEDDPAEGKAAQIDGVYNTYKMNPGDFDKIFIKHSK